MFHSFYIEVVRQQPSQPSFISLAPFYLCWPPCHTSDFIRDLIEAFGAFVNLQLIDVNIQPLPFVVTNTANIYFILPAFSIQAVAFDWPDLKITLFF